MPLRYRFLAFFRPFAFLWGWVIVAGCSSDQSARQNEDKADSVPPREIRKEVGEASWYGPGFQGRKTSSGETFDQKKLTAAHPSLPMGTKATVTNLDNGKQVEIIVNDRGPDAKNRVIDLSGGAANQLDMKKDGTARVKIETVRKKSASQTKTKLAEEEVDSDED